jgi:hypothetical protein
MLRHAFCPGILIALAASGSAVAQDQWLVDAELARRNASDVIVATVVHSAVPRGSSGRCSVDARVDQVERGTRFRPGARFEGSAPCVATRLDARHLARRAVPMREFRRGPARIYIAADGSISDLVTLARSTSR